MSNPVGPPVRGADFYGRESFVELVWEKLNTTSVLLSSPRRFGKTSVMYRMMDEPRTFRFIHADLQHLTQPSELLSLLIVQLSRDSQLFPLIDKLSYFPRKLWTGFTKHFEEVELVKLKIKLRENLRTTWQESGEELFGKIAEFGNPIVFVLDELPMMIERMNRSETGRQDAKTMLRWLRALRVSPRTKHIRFLVAGSIGIDRVLNQLGEVAAINDFEHLRLEPFSSRVARDFISLLAETHRLSLSKVATETMLHSIGTLIPYFIRIMFAEVYNAHRLNNERITARRVEELYRDRVLGVSCKGYFNHYYSRLHDYYQPREEKAVKSVLRQLALNEELSQGNCYQSYLRVTGNAGDAEEFNGLMIDLENDFYISFDSANNTYRFASKLLRDWWVRYYGMETIN